MLNAMDITVSHPDFKTQLLEIRISGPLVASRLLLNGVSVRRTAGGYLVLNDVGSEVLIQMNSTIFHRIPELLIEQESIRVNGRAGWTQIAGWKKIWVAQALAAGLKVIVAVTPLKKSNKPI